MPKKEKRAEERRHTDCGANSASISSRWIGQFDRSALSSSYESTKNAAARWMNFPKYSPFGAKDAKSREQRSDWQAAKTFTYVPGKEVEAANRTEDSTSIKELQHVTESSDATDKSNRLSQRMRDLYDFKMENDWPEKLKRPPKQHEDNRTSSEGTGVWRMRRNSQDTEFNYRSTTNKESRSPHHHSDSDERPGRSAGTAESANGTNHATNRRTSRHDYEETCKKCFCNRPKGERGNTPSHGDHTEIEPIKRNSRDSDVSYSSVALKRGSLDTSKPSQRVPMTPRRAFSQGEHRPATPVPPIDANSDRVFAVRFISQNSESPQRDSTRYKVYLT